MKIAKLIPYFGKWPEYINMYLETCRNNSFIDFVFINDLSPIPNAPSNIKFIHYTFSDLQDRIANLFQVNGKQIVPYKLCDFRPAYGVIFEEIVRDYDFWGYGDIDLFYGNLGKVITPEVWATHDIVCLKGLHLHGPFTFYRNTPFINHLFETEGYYKIPFALKEYVSFDEFGKIPFYKHISSWDDVLKLPSDNISIIAIKAMAQGKLSIFHQQYSKEALNPEDIVIYENGILYHYNTKEEYGFYHWVLEKRNIWYDYPDWLKEGKTMDKMYISITGFYSEKEFKNYTFIHHWRYYKGIFDWWILKISNYIRRRVGLKVEWDTYKGVVGWVKKIV